MNIGLSVFLSKTSELKQVLYFKIFMKEISELILFPAMLKK